MTYLGNKCVKNCRGSLSLDCSPIYVIPVESRSIAKSLDCIIDGLELLILIVSDHMKSK